MGDVPTYRAEPDPEFADRLEHELLRRLAEPAVSMLTVTPVVMEGPETDDGAIKQYRDADDRRRRPSWVHLAAGVLIASGLVAAVAFVTTNSRERQPAVARLAGNGLIAFVGTSDDDRSTRDIYVVAPDGTGLRRLTSTPDLVEYAPAWSPDGHRLAFVRTSDAFTPASLCATSCQLVVVDASTGVETFAADIPQPGGPGDGAWVPRSLAWSPDGRAIVIPSIACGVGGCGGGGLYDRSASTPRDGCDARGCGGANSVIADLETGAFTTFTPPHQAMWSPDGEWLSLLQTQIAPDPSLLLVPADLIAAGDIVVPELPGTRPLIEAPDPVGGTFLNAVEWMPDGSAILVSEPVEFGRGGIELVTVADGERRTLIENGWEPVVSPDGTKIAYVRGETSGGSKDIWVVAADGSEARRVTASWTLPTWSPDGSLLLLADGTGWFTTRPDGTDRTTLGIRDHTPAFPLPGIIVGRVDWQPLPPVGT